MDNADFSQAARLRQLSDEFTTLARQTIEPFFAARYARTAAELASLAAGLNAGTDEVVWADDREDGPADLAVLDS